MKLLHIPFLTIVVVWSLLTSSLLQAEELRFSVAASMTDVFKELISTFTATHQDISIVANYGPSGGLAKQINQGAPADLYVSANPKWMAYLIQEGAVAAAAHTIFAHNSLVFLGQKGLQVSSLLDLVKLERIGIGSPKIVPAGQYAEQALNEAGIYQQLISANKLVMAKDVRQALIYADRGETDGSFVYMTDARLANNATVLFEVPQQLYDRVSYPVGLTVQGKNKPGAVSFYQFIASAEAKAIMINYGFSVPE